MGWKAPIALAAALAAPAGAQLSVPLELDLSDPFPVVGAALQLDLSGPPGALVSVQAAVAPAEIGLGASGTLWLDPGLIFPVASGVLDAGGLASLAAMVPPDPSLDGALVHLQAGALEGLAIGLSGGASLRVGVLAPSGVRNPESVAVTPDGTRALVAHQEDGSVSAVDLVTGTLLRDIPVGPMPAGQGLPVSIAIDPDGRHAFVVNPWTDELAVLDVSSLSIAARLSVPRASRDVAFDFSGPQGLVYVSNERDQALLRFVEVVPGFFAPLPPIPLEGRGPGPLAVHPDGRVLVGHRTTHELELVDPAQPPGATTVARHPLGRLPYDLALDGSRVLVATFDVSAPGDGQNELLELQLDSGAILGSHLVDHGTDYVGLALGGSRLALVGAGSGSVVLGDRANLAFQGIADLAPFQPLATPQAADFVPAAGGEPSELVVVNYFRDSLSVVDVTGAGPYAVSAEVPLHLSGSLQLPLATLSQEADGDWWFRSVQFFNGTPQNPNPVTCASCHPYGAGSDGLLHPGRQAMPLFDAGSTAPYGSAGFQPSLLGSIQGTFSAHGTLGGSIPAGADLDILAYLTNAAPPPPSPHLAADGSLSVAAQAGRQLFEGAAGCSACHTAPLFIPLPPAPATVAGGVGTGLSPANVPSLRGLWSTGPYLHDHAADTLLDVLLQNPGDQHGVTSTLTPGELDQLVAYLRSL